MLGWITQAAVVGSEGPCPSSWMGLQGCPECHPVPHSLPPAFHKSLGLARSQVLTQVGLYGSSCKPRVPSRLVVGIAGNHSN